MDFIWQNDWERPFVPEMLLLEILLRGTLTYVALCLLLRFVLKRKRDDYHEFLPVECIVCIARFSIQDVPARVWHAIRPT